MSLILVIFFKVFFALKVNVYLFKNMSIKRRLARFDQKAYFRCFCVWTLNASFNSIQRSCWWPMLILVLSKLSKTSFLFLYLTESVKISRTTACRFSIVILFFPLQQTSRMRSKISHKDIWIGAYIVVQTGIHVRDVFSWK